MPELDIRELVDGDVEIMVDFYTAAGYDREERVNMAKWLYPARKPKA